MKQVFLLLQEIFQIQSILNMIRNYTPIYTIMYYPHYTHVISLHSAVPAFQQAHDKRCGRHPYKLLTPPDPRQLFLSMLMFTCSTFSIPDKILTSNPMELPSPSLIISPQYHRGVIILTYHKITIPWSHIFISYKCNKTNQGEQNRSVLTVPSKQRPLLLTHQDVSSCHTSATPTTSKHFISIYNWILNCLSSTKSCQTLIRLIYTLMTQWWLHIWLQFQSEYQCLRLSSVLSQEGILASFHKRENVQLYQQPPMKNYIKDLAEQSDHQSPREYVMLISSLWWPLFTSVISVENDHISDCQLLTLD